METIKFENLVKAKQATNSDTLQETNTNIDKDHKGTIERSLSEKNDFLFLKNSQNPPSDRSFMDKKNIAKDKKTSDIAI